MAHILTMPRQGNTVESCIITNWKVNEGDTVTAETMICEVETDKAAFEVPAGASGIVLKLLYESGDDVPVLKPIAVIGDQGEEWEAALSGNVSHKGKETQRIENEGKKSSLLSTPQPSFLTRPSFSISPRARDFALKEAVPLEGIQGSGPGGRIIERDLRAVLQNRPALSAAAKAAAPETLPQQGSGISGRITSSDLGNETTIKGVRKIIADRMLLSLAESAQLTLHSSAEAIKLKELHSALKAQKGLAASGISINDLMLFAVAKTLQRFPYMNAHKVGDTIRSFERVHLAMAVDTPRGLMVPVIRNADQLTLEQISSEARRLAEACQSGAINPDELSGSTFTVSNLGVLGVTSFTPILNPPEVAILGICSIELKPVLQSNNVNYEPYIGLSLTINHQAVDGAPAAKFLEALCITIAHIDKILEAK